MFLVDGWINIWVTLEDWSYMDRHKMTAVRELERVVEELGFDDAVEFTVRNEDQLLRMHLQRDRAGGALDSCRMLLEEVSRSAPASYGIWFFRDTDHPTQKVRRSVMRRGRVVFEDDDIFTSIPPKVEVL